MADTYNEEIRDALIRHQIGLMRVLGSINKRLIERLDVTEPLLKDFILRSLVDGLDPQSKTVERLLKKIEELRGTAFEDIEKLWTEELEAIAVNEGAFLSNAMKSSVGVAIDVALPDESLLKAIATKRPFQGRILKEWASGIASADLDRIQSQIKIGLVQGDSIPEIARRIVGTAQLKGEDGVTQVTRRSAVAITRTAVNHVANQAKRDVYLANSDLVKIELYVATLDSRTTVVCASNDGKRFPVGKGPIPPLHYQCRSTRVPVFDNEVLGNRPAKRSTERELVKEYSDKHNLGNIKSRDKLPRGHKGAFDDFQRRRVRQLTGTVPASTTYQEFLKNQTNEFQNEVLGETKAILFRKGGLTLDKFVNRINDELTLSELAIREKDAFLKAGLDPKEFL